MDKIGANVVCPPLGEGVRTKAGFFTPALKGGNKRICLKKIIVYMVYAPLGEGARTKAGFFAPDLMGGNLFGEITEVK